MAEGGGGQAGRAARGRQSPRKQQEERRAHSGHPEAYSRGVAVVALSRRSRP